ncbi:MAG TPA: MarR family winged helix-turn-helix transcriptional regulator [Acidimicrobiales bacterium]|jgi:MarR family 2-MHQ and catechol resistance regulon transcriptional repressor|nr:MarR family winged helix-turn-helix transcriptional regulator [Acidimicrobiales bacterium]
MAGEQGWDDERVTTVGLLFESSAGLRRILEPLLLTDSGLANQSFDVLVRLARTPGFRLRMSELAAQTTLTPSGLTRSVDRLEHAGMVTREACPEDRRGAFAVLSPKGQAVMAEAIPLHVAHIDELLNGVLTREEEETLSSLLRKIRDHIRGLGTSTSCDESDADEPVASGIS